MTALLMGTAVGKPRRVGERGRGRFYMLDGVDPLSRGQRLGSGQHQEQLTDARLQMIENDGQIGIHGAALRCAHPRLTHPIDAWSGLCEVAQVEVPPSFITVARYQFSELYYRKKEGQRVFNADP